MNLLIGIFTDLFGFFLSAQCVVVFFSILGFVLILLRIFRDRVVRFFFRKRNVAPIQFSENEVVTRSEPIRRAPLFGALLFVPQGTGAVVADAKIDDPQLFQAGERVIHFPSLHAFVQYVDIRRRTSPFAVEGAYTSDGFQVSLRGNVSWQVREARSVSRIKDPVLEILNEVEKAVRDVVSGYSHDQLVPHTESQMISDSVLIDNVCQILNSKELFRFITIHSLILQTRTADPNRNPPEPEPTAAELEARAAQITLQSRRDLIEIEKVINDHEIRLGEERAKFQYKIREQENELVIRREEARNELERERIRVKERSAALAPVLNAYTHLLTQSNGRSSVNDIDVNMLGKSIWLIIQSLGDCEPNILQGDYRDVTHELKDARGELYGQLSDAASAEGFTHHNLKETSNGRWRLEIWVRGNRMIFWYNLGSSQPVITDIIVVSSIDRVFRISDVDPFRHLKLKQVILKLLEKYDPD